MRKRSKKRLQLHRESLHALDLQASRGGVTQVDCTFVRTCTAATNCTMFANCTAATNCSAAVVCTTAG
jgi:hypothetical protein